MIHITHDNGNYVCYSDGSVYSRQEKRWYAPNEDPHQQ